jgi:hypothetical protein
VLKLRTLGQFGHGASFDKRFDALRYGQVGKRQRVPSSECRHARSGPFRGCPPIFIVPILRCSRGKIGRFWFFIKERSDALPGASSLRGEQKTMGVSMTPTVLWVKLQKNLQTKKKKRRTLCRCVGGRRSSNVLQPTELPLLGGATASTWPSAYPQRHARDP